MALLNFEMIGPPDTTLIFGVLFKKFQLGKPPFFSSEELGPRGDRRRRLKQGEKGLFGGMGWDRLCYDRSFTHAL